MGFFHERRNCIIINIMELCDDEARHAALAHCVWQVRPWQVDCMRQAVFRADGTVTAAHGTQSPQRPLVLWNGRWSARGDQLRLIYPEPAGPGERSLTFVLCCETVRHMRTDGVTVCSDHTLRVFEGSVFPDEWNDDDWQNGEGDTFYRIVEVGPTQHNTNPEESEQDASSDQDTRG